MSPVNWLKTAFGGLNGYHCDRMGLVWFSIYAFFLEFSSIFRRIRGEFIVGFGNNLVFS